MANSNRTFRDGPNMFLNACVGDNTGGDSDYGYFKGFAQAVSVLSTAAMSEKFSDPVSGEDDFAFMDALIYPICFCARHHVELFLKRQIRIVGSIRPNKQTESKGHVLSDLWADLKKACSAADRRLAAKLALMEEYVDDFAAIDMTGQTFRYQHDSETGQKHLVATGRINLETLARRFKEFAQLAEDFDLYASEVAREYSWGTHTSKLSRSDLYDLAVKLPGRSTWGSEEFEAIAQEFRIAHGLSSNEFSKATKAIQKHREFSAMVGVEIPLGHINAEIFERIKNFGPQFNGSIKFAREELASLDAVYETSPPEQYSEAYDHVFAMSLPDESGRNLCPADIARTIRNHSDRFRKGLVKLGQKTLLAAFDVSFPPKPVPTEEERRKAKARFETGLKNRSGHYGIIDLNLHTAGKRAAGHDG